MMVNAGQDAAGMLGIILLYVGVLLTVTGALWLFFKRVD